VKEQSSELNTLIRIFGQIEDSRDARGKRHRLIDIFVMAIYGLLWGHTDFTNMALELKYHEAYFTELLGLENGVPSHDTFSAVFSIIDPDAFLEAFITWITSLTGVEGGHVAIDGKAVRAATDKVHAKHIPYLVNAFLVDAGVCMGQVRVDEKTNEIKGIPELLDYLDLKGATVSIDAIGTQRDIAEKLKGKGADFVLPVKGNQPTLHDDIMLQMQTQMAQDEQGERWAEWFVEQGRPIPPACASASLDVYKTANKGHGRIENRSYYVLNDASCVDGALWPHVAAIGLVKRQRQVCQRDDADKAVSAQPKEEYETYIMSKKMSAEEFSSYVRGHWAVENSLHWVLDNCLGEDRCCARAGHATENLGLLRRLLLNLMNLDIHTKKMSKKAKQVYYRCDPKAVYRLLFEEMPRALREQKA
jgi:predicted transposase YbfD/YdcC